MGVYFDTERFNVGAHFLPGIINDDVSGLSDDDEQRLGEWLTYMPAGAVFTVDTDSSPYFAKCEITGLMSDCESLSVSVNNVFITKAIMEYHDKHSYYPLSAIMSYVEEYGVDNLENFSDVYIMSGSYMSTLEEYILESFYDCYEIPAHLSGYIDEKAIVRDLLLDSYSVIESHHEYHLFYSH